MQAEELALQVEQREAQSVMFSLQPRNKCSLRRQNTLNDVLWLPYVEGKPVCSHHIALEQFVQFIHVKMCSPEV